MIRQSSSEEVAQTEELSQTLLQRSVIIFTFIANFCFSVQTTFITCLLIEYALQSYIDSFVWVIPSIVVIAIQPYYHSYLEKRKHSLHTYLNNSIVCLIFAGIGNLLVMYSTFPQFFIHRQYWWFYHLIRIILSAIGWTLMDVGLTFLNTNVEKMSESIEDSNFISEIEITEFLAKGIAFFLAFRTCIKSPSWNNFHTIVDILYLTSALLCFTGVIVTLFSRKLTQNLQSLHPLSLFKSIYKSLREVPLSFETFFPGAKHILPAPKQLKQHFVIIFFMGYIINVIMIYSCIWFVWTIGQHQDELTSSILITGLRFGSMFLALFTGIEYFIRVIWCQLTKNQLEGIIVLTLIFNLIFNVLTVTDGHIVYLGLVVMSAAVLNSVHSIYFEIVDQQFNQSYSEYASATEFVDAVQAIVTLSAMPFFWAFVMNDEDMYRPLIGSIIGFVVMLAIWIWRWKTPKKIKME